MYYNVSEMEEIQEETLRRESGGDFQAVKPGGRTSGAGPSGIS